MRLEYEFRIVDREGNTLRRCTMDDLPVRLGPTREEAAAAIGRGERIERWVAAPIDELPMWSAGCVGHVMELGEQTHPPGTWMREGMSNHLKHARAHLRALARADDSEEHLEHALTRLAMALWCRVNAPEANEGDVYYRANGASPGPS